jgi:hypothetical protein
MSKPDDFSQLRAALARSAKEKRKARKKAARKARRIAELDLILRSDIDRAIVARYRRGA